MFFFFFFFLQEGDDGLLHLQVSRRTFHCLRNGCLPPRRPGDNVDMLTMRPARYSSFFKLRAGAEQKLRSAPTHLPPQGVPTQGRADSITSLHLTSSSSHECPGCASGGLAPDTLSLDPDPTISLRVTVPPYGGPLPS